MSNPQAFSSTTKVMALIRFGGVKARSLEALVRRYGDLDAILSADTGSLMSIDGMSTTAAGKIAKTVRHLKEADDYLAELRSREISLTTRFDEAYPEVLFELNDPPTMLYVRGQMPEIRHKSVALVGDEPASDEALTMMSRLSKTFTQAKVQVVATLVGGADAAAHLAARAAGGKSYAVIPTGFDQLDGLELRTLAIDIVNAGGVISEFPPEEKSGDTHFVQTNRILAGLSHGVVVTEVHKQSARVRDVLTFCNQIGKLAFVMIDPALGAFADDESLAFAIDHGAIPITGYDRIGDIIRSLV